jgi:tripartite-type tricarboxylate transporter receptor subunit TctC
MNTATDVHKRKTKRRTDMMRRTLLAAALGLALLPSPPAWAQTAWPAKPLKIVVPFAPGSFTDLSARSLALELTEQLGQQVVVENRGGAGGTLGADMVAKAAPDGYTLVLTDNSFVMAAGLYAKLPYDPIKDFTQVSQIAESPSIMVARQELPAKSVKSLVELARAKPGELTFGSGGQGSSAHLATELFLNVTGSKMTHVPFKGVAASIAEVVAGRIDISIASLASGMAQVRAGRVQGFAVSGRERTPLLPNVPTFAEAGTPAYDMSYWWGVAVPAGTPPAVVARLNQEIIRAADKPRLKDVFIAQGARAVTGSPAELTRRVEEEIKVWKNVIAKAGVKVE